MLAVPHQVLGRRGISPREMLIAGTPCRVLPLRLGRQEVLAREGALARTAGADQDDEGQAGDGDCHVG